MAQVEEYTQLIDSIMKHVLTAPKESYWPKVLDNEQTEQGLIVYTEVNGKKKGSLFTGTTTYDDKGTIEKHEVCRDVSQYEIAQMNAFLKLMEYPEMVCAVYAAPWDDVVDPVTNEISQKVDLIIGYIDEVGDDIRWAWDDVYIYPMIGGEWPMLKAPVDKRHKWVLIGALPSNERSKFANSNMVFSEAEVRSLLQTVMKGFEKHIR
jgi:hypothetical protein